MAVTVSLCMIVKDEEDVLARCLDSVKDLVEEIIVVDTGSSDRTKEIAGLYTDQVYDYPWNDDFAAARNEAFSRASMEYQMWLDADDVVEPEDRRRFQDMKETLPEDVDLVMLPYHVAFDGAGRPVMTYLRERLMKRERGYVWQGAVHEVIVPSGHIVCGEAAVCHRKIHPSDPDRNLRIYERMKKSGGITDPRHQFYYGRELYYHKRYEEAAEILSAFLQEGKGWEENEIDACLILSECWQNMENDAAALDSLFRSFLYDVPRPEICCAIGACLLDKGKLTQAAYWYQCAKDYHAEETNGGFINPDCRDFIPNLQLCVCYDRLGERSKALLYHEMAKALKPEDPAVIYNEAYFAGQST